jgi:3-hydroxyphenylacetate 6-hydroxylase
LALEFLVLLPQLNSELDDKILKGTQSSCIRAELLEPEDVDEEELGLVHLAFLYVGIAPAVATLQWSIDFLAQRPDIQVATLHAIQTHCGNDCKVLRDIDDDQGCTYMVALTKECLQYVPSHFTPVPQACARRCFTVARTSLPRSTVKEFTYDEKLIPASTTVFLNTWACNMGKSR